LAPGAFASNLVINGSFEIPTLGGQSLSYATGSTGLTGWTVTGSICGGSCVVQIRGDYTEPSNVGTIAFQPEDGSYSLDLTGAGNTVDGGIMQTVTTTPGTPYLLTFWVGNQDDRASFYPFPSSLQLFLNSVSQGLYSNANSTDNALNWQQFSLAFVGTGSDTIEFRSATPPGDSELGLDNVAVEATPEPASFCLMGAGALGLALLRKRLAR
jgi:hypothetical protein